MYQEEVLKNKTALALFHAGLWVNLPYSAIFRIEKEIWIKALELHCDEEAEKNADFGCFARCIIVVGKDRAKRHLKGWRKLLQKARKDIYFTVLHARLNSLKFQTKYFAPKLP